MSHRIGCHVGDPKYPGLSMVSALMLNVATGMSKNLYKGLLGRSRCDPRKPLRVIYTVGAGIPTPDCKEYGCKSPTVDGDSIMPFGKIGDFHNVHSPALGAIVSHNESMTLWVSSNYRFFQKKKKQPVSQEKSIKKVGFFSTKTGFTFKDMEHGNVVSFVTRPGSHIRLLPHRWDSCICSVHIVYRGTLRYNLHTAHCRGYCMTCPRFRWHMYRH